MTARSRSTRHTEQDLATTIPTRLNPAVSLAVYLRKLGQAVYQLAEDTVTRLRRVLAATTPRPGLGRQPRDCH